MASQGDDVSIGAESSAGGSKPWAGHPLLARPLYAFDLPAQLTSSLQLKSIDVVAKESTDGDEITSIQQGSRNGAGSRVGQGSREPETGACVICPGAPIPKGAAQVRAHLRSDWHRFNAALSRRGQRDGTLSEEDFQRVVEELSSDSESEGEEGQSPAQAPEKAPHDPVATLLNRMRQMSMNEESDITDEDDVKSSSAPPTAHTVPRDTHLWFATRPDAAYTLPQTQIGILRFLLPEQEGTVVPRNWYADTLGRMQPGSLPENAVSGATKLKGAAAANEAASMLGAIFIDSSGEQATIDEESEDEQVDAPGSDAGTTISTPIDRSSLNGGNAMQTWTILLLGGGDFAAITIALNPYERVLSQRKGTSERQFLVVARKQFHRYTTRKKQGGSQSAQDASGRFAKSAGAQLRRYGEQQLGDEIRDMLDTPRWRAAIQGSDRIWVRAGLRSARGVLWSWSGQAESPLDEMRRQDKVYSLPIATRKPTVGECLRCFAELTRVRVRHETEEDIAKRDAFYRAQLEAADKARRDRQEQRRQRLAAQKERNATAAAKSRRNKIKLDAAEQLRRERLVRLVDMLRKGRLQNAVNHLDKYEIELLGSEAEGTAADLDDADEAAKAAKKRVNASLPDWWRTMDAKEKGVEIRLGADVEAQIGILSNKQHLVPSTLLHVAAEGGNQETVNYFLVERRADPTIGIPAPPADLIEGEEDETRLEQVKATLQQITEQFPHRTAYDLCSTREARDAFRRLMAAQPDWVASWSGMDKGGARVPKALTGEMEEARNKEEETRDKRSLMRERARQRQRDAEVAQAHTITEEDRQGGTEAARAENATATSNATSNRLGGPGAKSAPRALQKQRDEAAGLTPEMRQRIEREKRARAAEARFNGLQSQ